jgi:CRP-like cAMP-binding protein
MNPSPSAVEFLRKCAIFGELDASALSALADRAHHRRFQAGNQIFRFGDPGQSMMIVMTGTVRVSRPTSKGKEIILGDLGPGEVIGEIAVLDGKERSADASALTNVEALLLDRREILPFLEAHPRLCMKMLSLLCARLRLADERMADVGFFDLSIRLAKTLLRRAPTAERSPRFKLPFSQGELAEMIGGTRESVNRQLQEWKKEGVLKLDRGWIIVVDREALTRLTTG